MKFLFTFFLTLFFFGSPFAQNKHEFVTLKEKTKGKRLELFAVNTNTISYDVFLRIETEDFRRSSARPVLKTIPPNSEVRLITMVKLNGKEGNYSSTFIVNEVAKQLSVRKDHDNFEVKFDNALRKKDITIYTKKKCDLCIETKQLLASNNIQFMEYSIEKDSVNLIKIAKELKKVKLINKALTPIIKIEDSLYTSLKTKQDVIDALKNHF